MKTMTLRQKVEAVLNDEKLTDYKIAKEMGIYVNSVTNFRKGEGDIGKMRLSHAERYAELYDKLQLAAAVTAESEE